MRTQSKHTLHWLLLAGLGLFVMSSSSPQCSKGGDPVTAPALQTETGLTPCESDCYSSYISDRIHEAVRFVRAIKACNNNHDCIDHEKAVHDQILAELTQDKVDCLANCAHEQGGGTGGQ